MLTTAQEEKLNDVHRAIVGNEKMGHKGIIKRLDDLEEYQESDKKLKWKIVGGVTVGSLCGGGIMTGIFTFIKSLLE